MTGVAQDVADKRDYHRREYNSHIGKPGIKNAVIAKFHQTGLEGLGEIYISRDHSITKRNHHLTEWQILNYADQEDAVFDRTKKKLNFADSFRSAYHKMWMKYHNGIIKSFTDGRI